MDINSETIPELKSMTECLNKMTKDGYTENFKVTEDGTLQSLDSETIYSPEEVKVNNFFRFEGMTDPEDSSILYALETDSGVRGTLVDAYGAYADPNVDSFIKAVENISKKNTTANNS